MDDQVVAFGARHIWPGQQLLTSPPFCLGLMWSEPKFTGCGLWILSSGGLLRSDWLTPNRVIAHYHNVNLISTLLDALIVQNTPLSPELAAGSHRKCMTSGHSRRVRCERTLNWERFSLEALLRAGGRAVGLRQRHDAVGALQVRL